MKKKVLALLLGGAVAVGGLFMQQPVTAQAVRLMPECEGSISDPHIKSSQVATVDGQLTVTIDLEFEQPNAYFILYAFDTQLEKVDRGCGIPPFYPVTLETNAAELNSLKESGTYTFSGLTEDKTYHVYCCVVDRHAQNGLGEEGEEDSIYLHYATYLGTNGSGGSSSDSNSSGSSSSDSASSGSSSSGNVSSGVPADSENEEETVSYEEAVSDRIQAAPSGSTIVMEKGVTALSNSTMKELLKKGDVSLKLEFTYQDKEYVIIIPAGAALDNDIPWYGPLYLAQHFGNSAGTAASETGETYEVKSGDSMSKIAAACNMTLQQLLAKNPQIKDPDKIAVGQKINR